MKKILISAIAIIISLAVYTQKTIDNPNFGWSTTSMIKVQKIDLLDTATVLHFKTFGNAGTRFLIPDKTYIQPEGEGEKLFIKSATGLPIGIWYEIDSTREANYKLIFPAVKKSTSKIDYGQDGEDNEGGSWSIYDIQIKKQTVISKMPKELQGNWFNTNTRSWEISFFDNKAIYKSRLWTYSNISLKNKKGRIELSNDNKVIELFLEPGKSDIYLIGETPDKKESYRKEVSKMPENVTRNEMHYELPIFKLDSVTYSGYFKGYSFRIGSKTVSVHVNDIITGKQNTYVGEIDKNGYFSIRIPIYYPHIVYVRSKFFKGSVFLEPGKDLFQLLNPGSADNQPLYMGESAEINADLQILNNIRSFDYYDMMNKITDMKPVDYKLYLKNIRDKDMATLDSVYKINTFCVKAYQVKRLDIEYYYFKNLMSYDMNFENAYREKNKVPRNQRTLPVKIDSLTVDYLNFLTNEIVNNPLAVVSTEYDSFINRLKFLDILKDSKLSIDTQGIIDELKKDGYIFADYEKKFVDEHTEREEFSKSEYKAYFEKYGKLSDEFYSKYKDTLQDFYKNFKSKNDWYSMEDYLLKKGIKLTENDKIYLKARDEFRKKTYSKALSDSVSAFHRRHNAFTGKYFTKMNKIYRNEKLEKIFGVKKGFATDIMDAQDACRGIVEEVTPVSDVELKNIQKDIVTPFISDYIALCNQQSKLKIEANRLQKGAVVNDVPKTQADVLFDSIMKKYTGKVVYVDFWATWCGPCRSGIEQIKPLKEEMAGENVVFVYITNPTSPENTYANMIPDIKGEHYRVSNDEWNYLSSKFNISGIPHYVLVGKKGEILNPAIGHLDNSTLKNELYKRMKE